MRLLCVEDDRVNALLLEQSCREAGVDGIAIADSGADALVQAPGFAPDLLVIDLHLPDTDGYALLRALRQALCRADLPAMLYTASPLEDVAEDAGAAGFTGVWNKPVLADEIRQTIASLSAAR